MKNKIAVIGGCGHVGLPLGIAFATDPNLDVTLIDINQASVDSVNSGKIHFIEYGGEELLRQVIGKNLRATTVKEKVKEADYVIFVTGTPVDQHLNPCVQEVLKAVDQYLGLISDDALVILRSTVFPGTTDLVQRHLRAKGSPLKVAFCPERVAQGYSIQEIRTLPQIVSAFDKATEDAASSLFNRIAPEVIRLTVKEAELTKLFANSWRYLEFAIANQHYMIAESTGASFNRIYSALTYHYPRAKTFYQAGFSAGPCLFKDTMQLSAYTHNTFFLGHAAMLVNEGLPEFVIQQLEKKMGSLEGKKIGLLGMAFKPNNDDTRDSLSYKVKKILETKLAVVMPTDVYQASHSKLNEIVETADALVLGVPHQEYKNLNLAGKSYVDCWGVWEGKHDLTVSPFDLEQRPVSLKIAA